MWEGLDQVPWAALEHNYGTAGDVPALLRASADPDPVVASDAFADLDNLLYHQGGWVCSAATAALPYLLDLAEGRATACRPEVVDLIFRLAEVGATAEQRFVDAGWGAALASMAPRILALLGDEDPQVRAEAIVLAVLGGLAYEDVMPALRQRWRVEQDRITRWDLVLGFGEVLAAHPEADAIRAELTGLLGSEDLQLRLAAIHALAKSDPGLPAAHVVTLVRAVRHEDAVGWSRSAWVGAQQAAIRSTGALLQAAPTAAAAFAVAVSDRGEAEQRVAVLDQAGVLLARWRTVDDILLPLLGDLLGDISAEVRYRAAFLLGCLGTAGVDYADRLATLAEDRAWRDFRRGVMVGDIAVWALARLHDPRAVPGLVQRLSGKRLGFETASVLFGSRHESWFTFHEPGIHEVLMPLAEQADHLTSSVVARLRSANDPVLAMSLCRVLAEWKSTSRMQSPRSSI